MDAQDRVLVDTEGFSSGQLRQFHVLGLPAPIVSVLARYQSYLRMTCADYCGDETEATRDGMEIFIGGLLQRCPRLADAASGAACTESQARAAGALLFNASSTASAERVGAD